MALPKWPDILKILTTIAPAIAATAVGPLGPIAVTALESVLGIQPSGDLPARQDVVAAAIAGATPETLMAIRKADQDFQVRMTELGFADAEALAKLAGDDRASARAREQTVRDSTPKILAYLITLGFFALLCLISFRALPDKSTSIIDIMTGALGGAWVNVIGFYYGSSQGSERKTELLAQSGPVKES
jgi:hypothetical protein